MAVPGFPQLSPQLNPNRPMSTMTTDDVLQIQALMNTGQGQQLQQWFPAVVSAARIKSQHLGPSGTNRFVSPGRQPVGNTLLQWPDSNQAPTLPQVPESKKRELPEGFNVPVNEVGPASRFRPALEAMRRQNQGRGQEEGQRGSSLLEEMIANQQSIQGAGMARALRSSPLLQRLIQMLAGGPQRVATGMPASGVPATPGPLLGVKSAFGAEYRPSDRGHALIAHNIKIPPGGGPATRRAGNRGHSLVAHNIKIAPGAEAKF